MLDVAKYLGVHEHTAKNEMREVLDFELNLAEIILYTGSKAKLLFSNFPTRFYRARNCICFPSSTYKGIVTVPRPVKKC